MYLDTSEIDRPPAPPDGSAVKGILSSYSFIFFGTPGHYCFRKYSALNSVYDHDGRLTAARLGSIPYPAPPNQEEAYGSPLHRSSYLVTPGCSLLSLAQESGLPVCLPQCPTSIELPLSLGYLEPHLTRRHPVPLAAVNTCSYFRFRVYWCLPIAEVPNFSRYPACTSITIPSHGLGIHSIPPAQLLGYVAELSPL
jgi:hypothetical protein